MSTAKKSRTERKGQSPNCLQKSRRPPSLGFGLATSDPTAERSRTASRASGSTPSPGLDASRQPLPSPTTAIRPRCWPVPGEGVGEAGGLIHFQQDVGDPDFGQAPVKVEDQLIGVSRRVGRNPVGSQDAVLDTAAWKQAHSCRVSESPQPGLHPYHPVGQPVFRAAVDGQRGGCGNDLGGHEDLFQVRITLGMTQPDVSRAKSVAQMEQHGDLPEVPIVTLCAEEAPPLRIPPHKANGTVTGVLMVPDETGRRHQ